VATAPVSAVSTAPHAQAARARAARGLDAALMLTAAAAVCVGILAAIALHSTPLTIGASLVAFAAGLAAPPLGLTILALMAALQSPLLPPPGFNAFLVAAILLGWVYRLPVDRPRLSIGAPIVLLGAFILYAFVQQTPEMASGYQGPQSYLVASLFIQLVTVGGAVLAAAVVLSGRDPYPFLAALLISGTLAAALAILAAAGALGRPLDALISRPDEISRAVGPFGNPNYFGQYLASAIALAAALLLAGPPARFAWLLAVGGLILAAALALTMSRGAFVALFGGLVALALTRSTRLGAAVVVVGVLISLFVYPAFIDWRLGGTNLTATAAALARSDEARLGGVLAGLALFDASPIFGVGFGQYSSMAVTLAGSPEPIAAHNWYLNVLGEAGLVGTVLWLLLLVSVAWRIRSTHPVARPIGWSVFGTLVVGSFFLEPPTSFQTSGLTVVVLSAVLVAEWGGTRVTTTDTPVVAPIPRATAPRPSRIGAG
jgi:O-antigen ligase